MKKYATLLISAMLVLCIAMLSACGATIFDGKYEAATETELNAYTASVSESNAGGDMDYGAGFQFKIDAKIGYYTSGTEFENMTCKIDLKTKQEDEKFVSAGEFEFKDVDTSLKASAYYKDGKYYTASTVLGLSTKTYTEVDFENYLGNILGYSASFGVASYLDITDIDLSEMGIESDKIKISFDKSSENMTKVKLECGKVEVPNEGTVDKMLLNYVFDADYNLLAVKCDVQISNMKLNATTTTSMSLSMTFEPYSGNISLPSDLDSYTALLFS